MEDKTTQQTLSEPLVETLVHRMVAVGEPLAIVLFGSHARGEAHPQSDLDLLVIEESDLPRHQRATKYRRALVGVHPSKDIVVWTPEEVAKWHTVSNAFITRALAEGKILYER
jgi:predicted nucleotidyltransferase